MNPNYKTLYELRLFHEFYLTDRTGKNVFELTDQNDRMQFLKAKFEANEPSIDQDLDFVFPKYFEMQARNFGLKLIPTYAGFKILVAVKAKKLASGITTYEPIQKLPNDLLIPVLLQIKNPIIQAVSNWKSQNALHAYPLFSNISPWTGTRSFPFLTAPIDSFEASSSYEQGELAKFGSNDIQAFYEDHTGANQWSSIHGTAFANQNDKVLVPKSIIYTFPKDSQIIKADFTLKDSNNNIVQEFHYKSNTPYSRIQLQVDPQKINSIAKDVPSENLVYTLSVTGSAGYTKTHRLLFFEDDMELRTSMGLVIVKIKSDLSNYKVLDASGKLITRKNAANIVDPKAPIFEINFKSKTSFWRYKNERNKNLLTGLYSDLLTADSGRLVTILPRPMTASATLLRKADNSLFYLPNPKPSAASNIENNKIYSDIMVPESSLFPLAP